MSQRSSDEAESTSAESSPWPSSDEDYERPKKSKFIEDLAELSGFGKTHTNLPENVDQNEGPTPHKDVEGARGFYNRMIAPSAISRAMGNPDSDKPIIRNHLDYTPVTSESLMAASGSQQGQAQGSSSQQVQTQAGSSQQGQAQENPSEQEEAQGDSLKQQKAREDSPEERS